MSLIYGLVIGAHCYLICFADTPNKKAVVLVLASIISFFFGVATGRGFFK